MSEEVKLMKGNEAIAHAAIRSGADGYFGYPITPQSEVMETLMAEKPWETTGMVVLQAESELAAINMVYGGACCGKAVMTSSSSPGISLKQEGISYCAGAELPCLILNVMRGGPGLGTIQPSQADYYQTCKGGGHGDYRLIVLAPASVQEMADFVNLGFDLAFKYHNPAMILSDGVIGQMMEKVVLPPFRERRTEEQIRKQEPWAAQGRTPDRPRNVITSLEMDPVVMEQRNLKLQAKYAEIEANEVRYEAINCEGADYLMVAFGSMARICQKAIDLAKEEGIKLGLLRPITLWPFPTKAIAENAKGKKGVLVAEINAGQMIDDVKLAVNCSLPVEHFGRLGGIVPSPEEVVAAIKDGEVVLLENTRFEQGEEKRDEALCKKLASYCDIYVNDAFGTAHRSHATTAAIAEYGFVDTAVCGFLIEKELSVMADALENPVRPFVAVLGGAKVADKLKVISNLRYENIKYLICGVGKLENQLKKMVKKLKIEDKVIFLGYRKDISKILAVSDIMLHCSYREGLTVAVMEAMNSALAVVGTNVRGVRDLIENNKGGFLHECEDVCGLTESVKYLLDNELLRTQFGIYNKVSVKKFSLDNVKKELLNIYNGNI